MGSQRYGLGMGTRLYRSDSPSSSHDVIPIANRWCSFLSVFAFLERWHESPVVEDDNLHHSPT